MFDVLIAGGGLVGAGMAVALQPLGLKVGLIDTHVFSPDRTRPGYDDRSVALSYGSGLIYQGMGLWQDLAQAAEVISRIHISDRGYFGATRLSAAQQQIPALGYVIESRVLGGHLYRALQNGNTHIIAPATVTGVDQSTEQSEGVTTLSIEREGQSETLTTRLLIVADGSTSALRTRLGIGTRQHDYQQTALIANVTTAKPHHNTAYERFTASGPLALLPMTRGRYSLVWTQSHDEAGATIALDDTAFLQQLQQAFGYRQGRFIKVGRRTAHPLTLVKSSRETAGRAVLIGNSSHTLHPVAGQGLNLALRDIAVLADSIATAMHEQDDPGASKYLHDYEQQRQADYRTVVNYTDGLVRVFSNGFAPLGYVRAGGLLAVDRIAPLRGLLARQSMGLLNRRSRLARGLKLV